MGLVFAAREPGADLAGLPELAVQGLPDHDARTLLDEALTGPLDARVRDLIIAETHGNPLALLELPRGLTPAELAGGFGLPGAPPGAAPLTDRIEDSFTRQLDALPADTRQLVQLAAADPSGDRSLVWRAAGRLGIPARAAAAAAVEAGLIEFGAQVQFRHPLARSAAYWSASLSDRQQMHAALAEVTDPVADPDRRAWHRAQAAAGPDEEVAAELERCAGRAQARGGLAAAAAFLERSVALTVDATRHAERILAAAQASLQAGAFDKALELLSIAGGRVARRVSRARVDLLRGQIAFASSAGSDAPALLLKGGQAARAARSRARARDIPERLERRGLSPASSPARTACYESPAPPGLGSPAAARLGRSICCLTGWPCWSPRDAPPRLRWSARPGRGRSPCTRAAMGPGRLGAAVTSWDEGPRRDGSAAAAAPPRGRPRSHLLLIYCSDSLATVWSGATSRRAASDRGGRRDRGGDRDPLAPYAPLLLAALRREPGGQLTATVIADAPSRGTGGHPHAHWAAAILYNGLGRYEDGGGAARQAAGNSLTCSSPCGRCPS